MNGKADVNLDVVITEHTQMNEEEGEMARGSPLENQATGIVTEDKGIGIVTPSKEEKEGKLKLSKLDSSPLGSFQLLQSSHCKVVPAVRKMGSYLKSLW